MAKYQSSNARIEKVSDDLYHFVVQDRFIDELIDDPKLLAMLAKESPLTEIVYRYLRLKS